MKLNKTKIKIDVYEYYNDFMVDIIENKDNNEAWLYHKANGIKEFIIGISKHEMGSSEFKELIEKLLLEENYIDDYIENYF